MELITGNEGIVFTKEPVLIDSIDANGHAEHFREDIASALQHGFRKQRINLRFAKCNPHSGVYDFGWLDEYMAEIMKSKVLPIVDVVHHTSLPKYLSQGFLDDEFEKSYLQFIEKIIERYGSVRHITLFNEMFTTLRFSGQLGFWHPYQHSNQAFVCMLINVGRAVSRATQILQSISGIHFVYFEACEMHQAIDEASSEKAAYENQFKMLALDLLLGRITQDHPLYCFLLKNGATQEDLRWFVSHPARVDMLGLDYYIHSTITWQEKKGEIVASPSEKIIGFADGAIAYQDYLKGLVSKIFLGETNIREDVPEGKTHILGQSYDRITWLKFMVQEYELWTKRVGDNTRMGFSWYPFVSSIGWKDDLATTLAGKRIDPVGVVDFDEATRERHKTPLLDVFCRLATGRWSSRDIPSYQRPWLSVLPAKTQEGWDVQKVPK